MPQSLYQSLKPLMRRSAEAALSGQLAGRELANVMYGLARCRIPEGPARPGLLDVLTVAAATRLRELKPQELANTAWALATAGHPAPRLFDAIALVASSRAASCNPQELSNMVWAFATLSHPAYAHRGAPTRHGRRLSSSP